MGPVRGPTGKSTRRALISLRRGDRQKRGRGPGGRGAGRVDISETMADALTARMINRAYGTTYRPEEIAGLEDAAIDEMVTAAQILDRADKAETDSTDGS